MLCCNMDLENFFKLRECYAHYDDVQWKEGIHVLVFQEQIFGETEPRI